MSTPTAMALRDERRIPFKSRSDGQKEAVERVRKEFDYVVRAHDEMCHTELDPNEYLSTYSLANHLAMVEKVALSLMEELGGTDAQKALTASGAHFHDGGKLDESCIVYRFRRKLTAGEKKIIDQHAELSSSYVLEALAGVRAADKKFLRQVAEIVRWHHKPWRIGTPWMREVAWVINLADTYVAMLENRHLPGKSQVQALKVMPQAVEENVPFAIRILFHYEIKRVLEALQRLYGVNMSIIA
jgi:response regulator RpfG family c-di-GMP phosphodiesterase